MFLLALALPDENNKNFSLFTLGSYVPTALIGFTIMTGLTPERLLVGIIGIVMLTLTARKIVKNNNVTV